MLVSCETEQAGLAGANFEPRQRRRGDVIDHGVARRRLGRKYRGRKPNGENEAFKPERRERCHIAMKLPIALSFALLAPAHPHPHPHPAVKALLQYTLRVDSADLSGWRVAIQLRTTSDTFRLAMAAHPEYDDRYWRFVRDVDVEPVGTVTRVDSAVWQ